MSCMIADAVPDDDESSERGVRAVCRCRPLTCALEPVSPSLLGALLSLDCGAIVGGNGIGRIGGSWLPRHARYLRPRRRVGAVGPHGSVVAQRDQIVDGSGKLNDVPHRLSCMGVILRRWA